MSSIEERLVRDIAAVTGGVVVTESDLWEAREGVVDRLDSRRQHDRRRRLTTVAAAAVVLPVLGFALFQNLGGEDRSAPPVSPAPTSQNADDAFLTGSDPTPKTIAGVWRVDNGTVLVLIGADGTVRFDDQGTLFSHPVMTGTYAIDGDLITVTTTDSEQPGCAGREFTMRASLPGFGAMRFVDNQSSSDGCAPMRPHEYWALEQVLPTNNEYLRGFKVPAKGGWQPPAGLPALYGDWMAEVTDPAEASNGGGGHLLELAPDGSYTVAEESGAVVDRGAWTLTSSPARLSLVSAGDSPTCDRGDRLVLDGVEHLDGGTTAMRATVEQDGCGGAWAPATWILLPHEGS